MNSELSPKAHLSSREEIQIPLPPTVNMHVVGHCNFACRYCYARFVESKECLPPADARGILAGLSARGVDRVSFAGGEPTLHRGLLEMLKACGELELVANVVTNASLIDRAWCREHLPWLRWLTISCDSHIARTNELHGRRPKKGRLPLGGSLPEHVSRVAAWLREWNDARRESEHVRLKVNVVVTRLNEHEDPSEWLTDLAPVRVKLMQQVVIPGENDDATGLPCSRASFEAYARRLAPLAELGIKVVAEHSEQLHDSYAMIDPKGRFRQSRPDGYVTSARILDVGVDAAWAEVGAYDPAVFEARGGRYSPGRPSTGIGAPIIALEGLDGSGKSTVARIVASALGGVRASCPPREMSEARQQADQLAPADRRAWYVQAGRVAMEAALDQVFANRVVVMDRSPATTAAYAAAEQGRVAHRGDLPARLPMPDAIYMLQLPEDVRVARIESRDVMITTEERRLAGDHAFRQRVLDGYSALGVIDIDASGPPEEVADNIIKSIELRAGFAARDA